MTTWYDTRNSGTVTDYQVGLWIDDLVATSYWVSLHSSDPRIGGSPTASELVTGGSYHRQVMTWTATGSRSAANVEPLDWASLSAATLTHIGVFDDDTAGNLCFAIALHSPIMVAEGKQYDLASGELYINW